MRKCIYVKEYNNTNIRNHLSVMVKTNICINSVKSVNEVPPGNILVISGNDKFVCREDVTIIIYEELINEIKTCITNEYLYYFDYYYLKNAMKAAKKKGITTLIIGSSYLNFGIDAAKLKNAVNCSLASQDLYYTRSIIKDICEINNGIKNIVIGGGYYWFHSDLSKTSFEGELSRVSNVYWPIFNDMHNAIFLDRKGYRLKNSGIFDMDKIMDREVMREYSERSGRYFYQGHTREYYAFRIWENVNMNWCDLSEEEKIVTGRQRAESHNKSIRYESSLYENIEILNDILAYCSERNINIISLVTPATKYYREHLSPKFKEKYYKVLEEAAGIVHNVDCFDDTNFIDEDFNDMDHLSDKGAEKMTMLLNRVLEEI